MSLRWRERVDIALAPGAVTCAVWPRGLTGRATERDRLECDPARQSPAWQGALGELDAWLVRRPRRGAEMRIVLSNHFARYVLLPWNAELSGRAEREALARHLFREKYGDAAESWSVHLGQAGYGEATLACAVDRSLHEALHTLCSTHGLQLSSLQSLLGLACDQFAERLGRDAGLFVLEPGRLCCVAVRGGSWQGVQSVRLGGGAWNDAWLSRQVDVMGIEPEVPLFLADTAAAAGPARTDAPYRLLQSHAAARGASLWSLYAKAAA